MSCAKCWPYPEGEPKRPIVLQHTIFPSRHGVFVKVQASITSFGGCTPSNFVNLYRCLVHVKRLQDIVSDQVLIRRQMGPIDACRYRSVDWSGSKGSSTSQCSIAIIRVHESSLSWQPSQCQQRGAQAILGISGKWISIESCIIVIGSLRR
jgi:hypothetical protein